MFLLACLLDLKWISEMRFSGHIEVKKNLRTDGIGFRKKWPPFLQLLFIKSYLTIVAFNTILDLRLVEKRYLENFILKSYAPFRAAQC